MTIEEVIKRAIDTGWDGDAMAFGVEKSAEPVKESWKVDGWWYGKEIFLDPAFWQSLGKAMGWPKTVCGHCGIESREDKKPNCFYEIKEFAWFEEGWQYY